VAVSVKIKGRYTEWVENTPSFISFFSFPISCYQLMIHCRMFTPTATRYSKSQ